MHYECVQGLPTQAPVWHHCAAPTMCCNQAIEVAALGIC